MTVSVRRMEDDDLDWARDLLNRFHGERMTPQERAEHGFVQGEWSTAKIAGLTSGTGGFVAEVDGSRAGLALTSAPGAAPGGGPAGELGRLATAAYGGSGYFLYGPVVVDDAYRRRGVLRALFDHLRQFLAGRFEVGVAFVEDANRVSLAAHRRLGFTEFDRYTVAGREYHALSFRTAERP